MSIRFGPAGLGSVKDAINNLNEFHKLGLRACEIAFTYGVYIKDKNDALKIGEHAKKLGIQLSIHAPYWINLNSKEKVKIEQSKKRILKCCEVGSYLNANKIVFHPGYYLGMCEEETYENIKREILDVQKEIKKNKWKVKLCPETTGKVNVFGKEDEILRLVKETNCGFTIDFSHLWARTQGKMSYKEMYEKVKSFKELHCHFSGIEFGEKGEKKHIKTPKEQFKKLISILPKNKDITIINESPYPVEDSVIGLKLFNDN